MTMIWLLQVDTLLDNVNPHLPLKNDEAFNDYILLHSVIKVNYFIYKK